MEKLKQITEKIKKRVKISIALLAAVGVSAAMIGSVYAWFTKTTERSNVFGVVTNNISVTEEFNPPSHWKPNDPVTKKVCFTNNGQLNVYIRVPAPSETWIGADGGFLSNQYTGTDQKSHDVAVKHFTDAWQKEWTQAGDYSYYKKILKAGEKTSFIMDSVTLAKDLPNSAAYQKAQYQLKITVEAVQSLPEAAQQVWKMQPGGNSSNLTWSFYYGT